jgi:Family of unknown function (DUF6448)
VKKANDVAKGVVLFLFLVGLWLVPRPAGAHCDTLEGPVVAAAKAALEKGDVTPVLKWVRKDDEKEIRELFQKTLVVRGKGKEAQELADRYFFETLVRIHRAGEGAPYTGLKSEPVEPIIQAADRALESGNGDHLVKHVSESVIAGIRERFNRVKEAKKHADESVDKGRAFVEAYVEYTHYVERLAADAGGSGGHHDELKEEKASEHRH